MINYKDKDNESGSNYQDNKQWDKVINTPLYGGAMFNEIKAKQAGDESKDDNNYIVVTRGLYYDEKKKNPNVNRVVSSIIDKRAPSKFVSVDEVGLGWIPKLSNSYVDVSRDTNAARFLTTDGAEELKKEKRRSTANRPVIVSDVKPLEELFVAFKPVKPQKVKKARTYGNSLHVTDRNGEYLFKLKGAREKEDTLTAGELYGEKIQWFAPKADNYMPLTEKNDSLTKSKSLKHFSSDEIFKFADTPRSLLDFRSEGSGDWKAKKEGGDDYLMVSVDDKPYWADAVGQVPFAINTYKTAFISGKSRNTSKNITSFLGGLAAEGDWRNILKRASTLNPDRSNSYDNSMIKSTMEWADKKYYKPSRSTYLKSTDYPSSKLFDYEKNDR